MNNRLLICLSLLGTAALSAAPCTTATLEDYRALSAGCEVGDKRFSNFNYSPLNTLLGVADESITVQPLMTAQGFGLRFIGPFVVTGLDILTDTAFRYDVETVSGQPLIVRANAALNSTVTGLGAITIDEFIFDGLIPYRVTVTDNPFGSNKEDSADVAPTNQLRVIKDIFITGGLTGTATLTSFDQTFTQIPEPGSALLVTSAAALLFAAGARKRSAKSSK